MSGLLSASDKTMDSSLNSQAFREVVVYVWTDFVSGS